MTAALFSNPNWDQTEAKRDEYITNMNKHYNEAIEFIYFPEKREGPEIDWTNPFYAAAKRGLENTRTMMGLEDPDKSAGAVLEDRKIDVDQFKQE